MHLVRKLVYLFPCLLFLAACAVAIPSTAPPAASASPLASANHTPTTTPPTPTIPVVSPTSTEPALSPALTIPPTALPGRLRVVYMVDGNLYLQDEGRAAIQLTSNGQDWGPALSTDGETILFFRSALPYDTPNNLYAIQADGSGERALITNDILSTLNPKYNAQTEILHWEWQEQIFFNTHQIAEEDLASGRPVRTHPFYPNRDFYSLDVASGAITSIVPAGEGGGRFRLSPDGERVAFIDQGSISVFTIAGEQIALDPGLPAPASIWDVSWAVDADTLVILLTTEEINDQGPVAYTPWLLPIADPPAQPASLDPPPMGDSMVVSAGGSWILYPVFDAADWGAVYLGSLQDGLTRKIADDASAYAWHPSENLFVLQQEALILFAPGGTPITIGPGRFLQWIDDDHLLYFTPAGGQLWFADRTGRTTPLAFDLPEDLLLNGPRYYVFALMPDP